MTEPATPMIGAPVLILGDGSAAYAAAEVRAREGSWANRLFDRDVTLWSDDPTVGAAISERLGWLGAPEHFTGQIAALEGFGDGIAAGDFSTVVVAGMGGSSLAPDVLYRTFGATEGYLDLRILDSTDPAAVASVLDDLDPLTTLVIVASKSGTTVEPNAFLADVWAGTEAVLRSQGHPVFEHAGETIAAITDPGKSLEALDHHDDFLAVFLNPPDIGGRYSALTYVGLVPASLIGLDLDALLASASAMMGACHAPEPAVNPGVSLGLAIGTLAIGGRDKLTFLIDDEIAAFGAWVEQLVAESTGKNGVGIIPVVDEPPADAAAYGADRAFVRLALEGSADGGRHDERSAALVAAGHPVIRITIADPIDLGAEFVRWEVATAIAGVVLGIDPFDQPNVEEAKQRTRDLLPRHDGHQGRRDRGAQSGIGSDQPAATPLASAGALTLYGEDGLATPGTADDVSGVLARHLARRGPSDYLALQAFVAPTTATDDALARIRTLLRDRTGQATTTGYGPRFLHSTGQLHKGGAPNGWFLQLTADHPVDRPIPDWPYTFGQLIDAQAAGDFAALQTHGRPILRVHLGERPDAGLAALEAALQAALDHVAED